MRLRPSIFLHVSAAAGIMTLGIPGVLAHVAALPLVAGLVAASLGVMVFHLFQKQSLMGAFFLAQGARALMLLGVLAAFHTLALPQNPLVTSLILMGSFLTALTLDLRVALGALRETSAPGVI